MTTAIIDRIKKLLALANDKRGNEAEAKAAMGKAHALLSEYNLAMADIEDLSSPEDFSSVSVERNTFFETCNKISHYKLWVWDSIARLFYGEYFTCKTYTQIEGRYVRGYRHTIIADPINAEAAKVVAVFVINQIEALAKSEASGMGRQFIDSYKKGVAARISERVDQLILEAKQGIIPTETGSALMCLNSLYEKTETAISLYMQQQNIRPKAQKSTLSSNSGFLAGKQAGDRVSLNRPLAANNNKSLQ